MVVADGRGGGGERGGGVAVGQGKWCGWSYLCGCLSVRLSQKCMFSICHHTLQIRGFLKAKDTARGSCLGFDSAVVLFSILVNLQI